MKRIGIDQSLHDIYESAAARWHSVWPSVSVVSVAALVERWTNDPVLPDLDCAEIVFPRGQLRSSHTHPARAFLRIFGWFTTI